MTPDRRFALLDGTLLPDDGSLKYYTQYVADVRRGVVKPHELPGSTVAAQYRELQLFLNAEVSAQLPHVLNSGYGLDRLRWVAYPDPLHINLIFAAMSPLSLPEEGIEQAQATLELFYMNNHGKELRTKLTNVRFAAVNHAGIVCAQYQMHADRVQAPSLISVDFSSNQAVRDTLTMIEPWHSERRAHHGSGLTTNAMTAVNPTPLFHFSAADGLVKTLHKQLLAKSALFTTSVAGNDLRIRLRGGASQIQYRIPMFLTQPAAN